MKKFYDGYIAKIFLPWDLFWDIFAKFPGILEFRFKNFEKFF